MNNILEDLGYICIAERNMRSKSNIANWLTEINEEFKVFEELRESSNDFIYIKITLSRNLNYEWTVNTLRLRNLEFRREFFRYIIIHDEYILKLISFNYFQMSIHVSREISGISTIPFTWFLLKQIEIKDKKINAMMDVMGNMI